jgi:NADH-quinone oxidoreductase subunit J
MHALFYVAAVVAILATMRVITCLNAVHALLYLIVSLLSVAIVFYTLGAPFIAALEVIVYAGAIMVLFVFVVMMLNLGAKAVDTERTWLKPSMWFGPCVLAAILIAEVAYLLSRGSSAAHSGIIAGPKQVGMSLFGTYLIGVELASMLLLGALVAAYHLSARKRERLENCNVTNTDRTRTAAGGDLVRAGTGGPSRAA